MEFRISPGRQIQKRPKLASLVLESAGFDETNNLKLDVEARFSEDNSPSFFGMLRFGLKRVSITLDFDSCKSLLIHEELDKTLALETDQQISDEKSSGHNTEASNSAKAGIELSLEKPKFSSESTEASKVGSSQGAKLTVSLGYKKPNVVVSGTATQRQFILETPHADILLKGKVRPSEWCIVALGPRCGKITATLSVAPRDISINGVGGIWPKEISNDKRTLIWLFALRSIDIEDYLSVSEINFLAVRTESDVSEEAETMYGS